jgi:vacuolar-type H+-ATPase subunit E/Vma4
MEFFKGNDLDSEKNLAELCKQIQMESKADCDELGKAAAAQEAAILASSKDRADQLRKKILDSAEASIEENERSSFAEIKLKVQHLWLESRETLLDQVRTTLFGRFDEIVESDAYAKVLPAFIIEAAIVLGSKILTLQADPVTRELFNEEFLSNLYKTENISLNFGDKLPNGHGIIALTQDGRQLFDNTLEARFERNKTQLRNLSAQKLFEGQV